MKNTSVTVILSILISAQPAFSKVLGLRQYSVKAGVITWNGPGTIDDFWHTGVNIGAGARLPIFADDENTRFRLEFDYGYLPSRKNTRFPMNYVSDDQAVIVSAKDAHLFSALIKFQLLTNRTILNCAPLFSLGGGVIKRTNQILRSDSPLLSSKTTHYGFAGTFSIGLGLDFALRNGKGIMIQGEIVDSNTKPGRTFYGAVSVALTFK